MTIGIISFPLTLNVFDSAEIILLDEITEVLGCRAVVIKPVKSADIYTLGHIVDQLDTVRSEAAVAVLDSVLELDRQQFGNSLCLCVCQRTIRAPLSHGRPGNVFDQKCKPAVSALALSIKTRCNTQLITHQFVST